MASLNLNKCPISFALVYTASPLSMQSSISVESSSFTRLRKDQLQMLLTTICDVPHYIDSIIIQLDMSP
jgi:hypothetical protein